VAMHDTLAGGIVRPNGDRAPGYFLGDYWNTPQVKAMLDITYQSENRLMARFTNSGNTQLLTLGNPSRVQVEDAKDLTNSSPIRVRQYMVSYENNHRFDPFWSLVSTATWNDQDYQRNIIRDTTMRSSFVNIIHSFSEKHLFLGTLGKFSPRDNYKFALGAEYVRNIITHPWFEDQSKLRLGDAQNMFGDTSSANPAIYRGTGTTPTGYIIKGSEIYVGDGWQTNTYSFVGEANLDFHKLCTFVISGRADKNDYTNWGLSPRVAWIGELNDQWITKLIAQRSVRMNFMEQSYLENKKDTKSDPEVLNGLEGIVGWMPSSDLSLNLAGYYNIYNLLGFSRADTTTKRVGTLKLAGLEFETKYAISGLEIGASHSFLHQLDYALASTATQSGISYADFEPILVVSNGSRKDTVTIHGYGNNLNNWPNNATKLYFNWKVLPSLTWHVDSRIFWNFAGGKDGLDVYLRNADALPSADSLITQRVHEVVDSLRAHNMFDMDFRVNTSLSYEWGKVGTISLYCQNLLGLNENKRYPYDAGDIRVYSSRWQYISEPRSIGIKIEATLR